MKPSDLTDEEWKLLRHRIYNKKHRKEIRKKSKERGRTGDWNKDQKYLDYRREYTKKYRKQHPEVARVARLSTEISPNSKCAKCGRTESLVRHHPDYDKPKEFVILCQSCHLKSHKRGFDLEDKLFC